MMQHKYTYVAIMLCLFSYTCVLASNNLPKHYLVTSFAGGYSKYFNDYTHINNFSSANWDLFIGYEYESLRLITQTGVGVRTRMTNIGLEDYQTSIHTYDTQGKMFEYTYQFTNRQDKSTEWALTVPVLIGAKFPYVYLLAGVMNNIHLHENYSKTAYLTCKGHYDRYIQDYTQMDNHAFYTNEPIVREGENSNLYLRYQLYPYVEFGVDVLDIIDKYRYYFKSSGLQIRIAAYAYVATINTYVKPTQKLPYLIDEQSPFNISKIHIPEICNSQYVAQTSCRDWTIGIRISLLFDVSADAKVCLSCELGDK